MIERVKEEGRLVGALAGKAQHAERHVKPRASTSSSPRAPRPAATPARSARWCSSPRSSTRSHVPVLGAGGIGRGRQMAAAMALGAQGVWCGSVWLTTDEAETHPVVKEKFLAATSADTVRSRSLTGKPARQLQVGVDRRVGRRADTPDPLGMPLQPILVAEAPARIHRAAYTKGSGAEKLANYFVGQIVGTMNQPKPAAQVVFDMIEEFIEAVEALANQLED